MDSLSEVTERRAAVRAKLEAARGDMQRAASAANFKGDPAAPIMEAFAGTLDAIGAIYEASAETQIEIDRRLIGERIVRIKKELATVTRTRALGKPSNLSWAGPRFNDRSVTRKPSAR